MDIETATAVPRSPVSIAVTMRGHQLVQDKPHASGGADGGPMASELLLAALLACQHSTFVKVAAKRRLAVEIVALRGELGFEGGDITQIRLAFDLRTGGESDEALQTCLRLTDKACTVSQILKIPVAASFRRHE